MGVIYCCIWWINCFFCFFIIWNINNLKRNKMKETLEEAAEKYAEGKSSSSVFQEAHKRDFINGAKWQQERSYSEEEVENICGELCSYFIGGDTFDVKEWFEQFKK